jgi:hypothetical protein
MHIFSNFFSWNTSLVDQLTGSKKNLGSALFYRKIGPKMTFDLEDPSNPVEITFQLISFILCPNKYFYHKSWKEFELIIYFSWILDRIRNPRSRLKNYSILDIHSRFFMVLKGLIINLIYPISSNHWLKF